MLHMNNNATNRHRWNQLKSIATAPSGKLAYYISGMMAGSMIEAGVPADERERLCKLAGAIASDRFDEVGA